MHPRKTAVKFGKVVAIAAALLSIEVVVSAARGQNAAGIAQEVQQQMQLARLTQQIGQLQIQSANLAMQIQDLTGQDNTEPAAPTPPTPPTAAAKPSPELLAATKAVADASAASDKLRETILSTEHDTPEYLQAQALLKSDESHVAHDQAASNPHRLEALANKILADKAQIRTLEEKVLNASPPWKNADAQLQQANQSLQAAQEKQSIANTPPAQPKPTPATPAATAATAATAAAAAAAAAAGQLRDLTAQRDAIEARIEPLLREVSTVSPETAQLLSQQGEAIKEALPQMRAAQKRPGDSTSTVAPPLHFSATISPQVQQFIQQQLDEQYRLHDPAYVAQKREQEVRVYEQQMQQYQMDHANWENQQSDFTSNNGPPPGPEPQPPPPLSPG